MPFKSRDDKNRNNLSWYYKNKDKALLYARIAKQRRRAENPRKYWTKNAISSARQRAKEKNLAFDIDEDYILSICPVYCPALGVKLLYEGKKNAVETEANVPNIDRLIPSLGYIKGNVSVISALANRIKNNGSPQEIRKVLEWLENRINEAS